MNSKRRINDKELLEILEKKLPSIIKSHPEALNKIRKMMEQRYVVKDEIKLILNEMRKDREAFMKRFETMDKRFIEIEKRLEVMDKRFMEMKLDTDKRFEEMNKRFEAIREDMNKRFEDVNKRFEDVNKRFEDVNKRFEEVNQRFEDINKRFEDINKRFEDVNKRFEDVNKRFEVLINDMNKRFEEVNKRFELIIEDMDKRFEEVNKRFELIIQDMDKRFEEMNNRLKEMREDFKESIEKTVRALTGRIDTLGSRWGMMAEDSFRNALENLISEFGFRIIKWRGRDDKGKFFLIPRDVEIDILIMNHKTVAVEMKSSLTKGDVEDFERAVRLYEKLEKKKVNAKYIVAVYPYPGVKEYAEELGIKVISQAEDIFKKKQ